MTVKKLREQSRMTQAEFSEFLKIPIRTIQEWEQGRRTPPDYVVELIRYKVETAFAKIEH
jgi:DNA-binding transcriptional regulator YiaG